MKRTTLDIIDCNNKIQTFNKALCALAVLGTGLCASLAQVTVTNSFSNVNKAIPDGQPTGVADTRTLTFTNENFFEITNISVSLTIAGGYNGDLYGYLVHDDGFAVLFNREGRTTGNGPGYSHHGFNITLADTGKDLHFYQSFPFSLNNDGQLTGTWAPDGRNVDPGSVTENAVPSALLGSFKGSNPNGTWTLFLADMDYGERATLVDWGLAITAVPEPKPGALIGLGGLLLFGRFCLASKRR
jgi:subtilisin-like proprotein convertase family protein